MIIEWHRQYLMGFLLVVVSLTVGCSSFMEAFGGKTSPAPTPSSHDNGAFEYALSVYQRGNYAQAASLFNALSAAETDGGQRPQAKLGEICCRLVLADSPEDLSNAMEMWKKLAYSATEDNWRVEQVLLDPLIARFSVAAGKPSPAEQPSAASDKPKETELTETKKKAAQAAQLQRQLDAVMAENKTLKQKIKALEAIDHNIQKKKTEISAPSE